MSLEKFIGEEYPALTVHGGIALRGSVEASGFKHSLVTLVAASASAHAQVRIRNCPDIVESAVLAHLLRSSGAAVEYRDGSMLVNGSGVNIGSLDAQLVDSIHGSIYLIPAILSRCGQVRITSKGGCRIGPGPQGQRPVDQYVSVLQRFGATASASQSGELIIGASRLSGCDIDLLDYTADKQMKTGPRYSGATKMAVLLASVAYGPSVLQNPYPKPDVTDLVQLLQRLGAQIDLTASGALRIEGRGGHDLDNEVDVTLISDLIEIVTWIAVGAMHCDAPLRIAGHGIERAMLALAPELDAFSRMGVELESSADGIIVHPADNIRPADITVASCSVYSDSHPILSLLATNAKGRSTITETVWHRRFSYVPGLNKLGARLRADGATVVIDGPSRPSVPNQRVHATDLRAASVLLLAALAVPGVTIVHGLENLARGYADLPGKLRSIGACFSSASDNNASERALKRVAIGRKI